jgi:3-oxoacyl-[acyl-carrier-protein] synthase II
MLRHGDFRPVVRAKRMRSDYLPTRALRRMDHFTRMTLLAASTPLRDADLDAADLANTGIILATGWPAPLTSNFSTP